MSHLNRGKIVKRGATVRVPMIARGPVVRLPLDPILVESTNQQEQARDVPQYKPQYVTQLRTSIGKDKNDRMIKDQSLSIPLGTDKETQACLPPSYLIGSKSCSFSEKHEIMQSLQGFLCEFS